MPKTSYRTTSSATLEAALGILPPELSLAALAQLRDLSQLPSQAHPNFGRAVQLGTTPEGRLASLCVWQLTLRGRDPKYIHSRVRPCELLAVSPSTRRLEVAGPERAEQLSAFETEIRSCADVEQLRAWWNYQASYEIGRQGLESLWISAHLDASQPGDILPPPLLGGNRSVRLIKQQLKTFDEAQQQDMGLLIERDVFRMDHVLKVAAHRLKQVVGLIQSTGDALMRAAEDPLRPRIVNQSTLLPDESGDLQPYDFKILILYAGEAAFPDVKPPAQAYVAIPWPSKDEEFRPFLASLYLGDSRCSMERSLQARISNVGGSSKAVLVGASKHLFNFSPADVQILGRLRGIPGHVFVPLTAAYHAFLFAYFVLIFVRETAARHGEVAQVIANRVRTHLVQGRRERYVALIPKGCEYPERYWVSPGCQLIIDELEAVARLRGWATELNRLGDLQTRSVPCGNRYAKLPPAPYLLATPDGPLYPATIVLLLTTLLAGVASWTPKFIRMLVATDMGLKGFSMEEIGAVLHHRPGSAETARYDHSGRIRARRLATVAVD